MVSSSAAPFPDSGARVPKAGRRPGRWRRLFFLLVMALLAAGLTVWLMRVKIANTLLARASDEWRVTVDGLEISGGGLALTGVTVRRQGEPEPVFTAKRAVSSAGIRRLRAGDLGDLTLEQPVFRWTENPSGNQQTAAPSASGGGSAKPGARPAPGVPLVVWKSLTIRDGSLSLRTFSAGEKSMENRPKNDPGSLFLQTAVHSTGGGGTVFRDGSVQTEPQHLRLQNVDLEVLTEASSARLIRLTAPEVSGVAALDHRTRLLEISRAVVTTPALTLEGRLPEAAPPVPAGAEEPPWLNGVVIQDWSATGLTLRAAWPFAKNAPPVSVSAGLKFAGHGLRWMAHEGLTTGTFRLAVTDLKVPEILTAAALETELVLSPEGLHLPRLRLQDGAFTSLQALLQRTGMPEEQAARLPELRLRADADLQDWRFSGGKFTSSALQTLTLREAEAVLPDGGAARAAAVRLSAVPDEVKATRRLRLLEMDQPSLSWPGVAPETTAAPPGKNGPAETGQPEDSSGVPVWQGWTTDVLTVTGGSLRAVLPQAGKAVLSAAFTVSTDPAAKEKEDPAAAPGDPLYRVKITGPRMDLPAAAEADQALFQAGELEILASPVALWARREINSASLTGSRLEIGEAFFRILQKNPAPAQPPGFAKGLRQPENANAYKSSRYPVNQTPPWRLRKFTLQDTLIKLDDLGDGRRLEIPVAPHVFTELPLDGSALADFDRIYQVEVPNITIFSPWVEGQKVAVLDGNYVRFSASGIMQKRLERVELMLPSLYAGQPLFDYIEAARKRFQTMGTGQGQHPELTNKAEAEIPFFAPAPPPPAKKPSVLDAVKSGGSGWHIPFYAASGKVIVAPKGNPWPDIPVFPFRNARGRDGRPAPFLLQGDEFHGELAVEPGWYEFPQYKLRLQLSSRGRIVFNSPVKNQSNNLVEVFEDNTVIFRQLRIDKVWLAVTYDRSGIYARFGGATCGGYINGQVNLYLDELYTWDGSVSFSKINMKLLTDKLTPDYVRMDGVIDDLTLRAWGDIGRLYQTTGSLKVSRPGRLEIIAMDALQGKLQEMEAGISRQLGEIGIDTLREFAFTSCTGSLQLHGTEGKAALNLSGPAGSRNFRFSLRDYRVHLPKSGMRF